MCFVFLKIIVSRMIMKNTIEHELYLRNNSDDIQQVEFNFDQTNQFGPQVHYVVSYCCHYYTLVTILSIINICS